MEIMNQRPLTVSEYVNQTHQSISDLESTNAPLITANHPAAKRFHEIIGRMRERLQAIAQQGQPEEYENQQKRA